MGHAPNVCGLKGKEGNSDFGFGHPVSSTVRGLWNTGVVSFVGPEAGDDWAVWHLKPCHVPRSALWAVPIPLRSDRRPLLLPQ